VAQDVPVLESARRHGVDDDDMRHAYRNAVRVFLQDDETRVYVGPDFAGRLLEVGVVDSDEGPLIIHAMQARPKYLR